MFETPILILIFNRPELTQLLLDTLRPIRPSKLYVSADGPRKNKPGEAAICEATRKIMEQIDWDCELKTRYADDNLGCRIGVSQGITWFFEQEEYGIILEDDCLPQPSFFRFCEELLLKYQQDSDIWMVSGNHPFPEITQDNPASYFFIKFPFIWGWATWRRAWKHYDLEMRDLDQQRDIFSREPFLKNRLSEAYLWDKFVHSKSGVTNTWDFQWFYTILKNEGKCILPAVNMVENKGFGEGSTHTSGGMGNRTNEASDISFPLVHPVNRMLLSIKQHQELFYAVFKSKWRLKLWRIKNILEKVLKQK